MKRTIFLKVFSRYLLIVLAVSVLILVFSFRTIRKHYLDTLAENLKDFANALALDVVPLLEKSRFEDLDASVKKLGERTETRITVINTEGVVLADSEEDPELMDNHKTRPEVIQALQGGVGTSLRFSSTVKEEMLYVALPLEKDGRILGVVRTSLFLSDVSSLLGSLGINLIYIALVITGFSILVAFFFSRGLSRPIRELKQASNKLASGDFEVRVFLKDKGDLKELANSFNHMAGQIKRLFTELSRQKEELNSIISSLREGLLLLDRRGKILMSNESFKEIVQSNLIEGKFYWEVIREPNLDELIEKVGDKKRSLVQEVTFGEKVFLCSVAFLKPRKERIVLLHDITQIKSLEKIKKDFVANVSHELRTPLTAIKGFAETLEEEVGESQRQYVDIIKRHTDRLINIIRDLLLLSELEGREARLEKEKVNLKKVIESIIPMFERKLKDNKLKLKLRVKAELPLIKADPFKIEQMFINLVDNAIKYTEKGEIRISLNKKENQIIIAIEDTGIGISKEHLSRIFERFYVVDKSRSKRLGGTGLGLSLVKHIVLLHNGSIDVKSSPGAGTKFLITFPINPF